jgi:hypothetical protein
MYETHFLWLGVFTMTMTVAWLFVERRVTTTAMLSAIGWSVMALTGGNLTRVTEDGSEISTSIDELQWICTLLALLSFVVLVLYRFGHYPPTDDDATQQEVPQ